MALTDQFTLALQAYREVAAELGQKPLVVPEPPPVELEQFNQGIGELPEASLLLGVSSDGKPILLNLLEPSLGSVLVIGDGGSGKTAFLQMLARSVDQAPGPGDIRFGVLTNYPDEWTDIEVQPSNMGIWPSYHDSSSHFLHRLITWGDQPRGNGKLLTLLFVDDLETLLKADRETRHNLRWLLTYGPEHGIWPVATLNAGHLNRNAAWLQYFGTLITGYTLQSHLIEDLTGDSTLDPSKLYKGAQFGLWKPEGWSRFWIPSIYPKGGES